MIAVPLWIYLGQVADVIIVVFGGQVGARNGTCPHQRDPPCALRGRVLPGPFLSRWNQMSCPPA